MRTNALLLTTVFVLATAPMKADVREAHPTASVAPMGGPPSVRLAGKAKGAITRAEWATATKVGIAGCVPDAQVVEVTLCIKDCKGKDDRLTCKGDKFLSTMKAMVANLPDGTTFSVRVKVVDGKGKSWEVPEAVYAITR